MDPEQFLSLFPRHDCGMTLDHNPHLCFYQSAEDWIHDHEKTVDWASEEAKAKAVESNDFWVLHWFPDTPVGSYAVAAPTFAELCKIIKED